MLGSEIWEAGPPGPGSEVTGRGPKRDGRIYKYGPGLCLPTVVSSFSFLGSARNKSDRTRRTRELPASVLQLTHSLPTIRPLFSRIQEILEEKWELASASNPNDNDDDTHDTDDNVYALSGTNIPHTVRVRYASEPDFESDVGSHEDVGVDTDTDIDPLDTSATATPSHTQMQRKRIVSWDGVKEQARNRWTTEQEEKLEHARAELARCQKAWSSEQEVWLKCIDNLMEEKTAHEGFINNRRKHSCDEQIHFRKAFERSRRRSGPDQVQRQGQEQLQRLSRAHRTGSLPVRLVRFRGRN